MFVYRRPRYRLLKPAIVNFSRIEGFWDTQGRMKKFVTPFTTVKRIVIWVLSAALLHGTCPFLEAGNIEGVTIPDSITINGQSLRLNGAGLREISLLGVPIKLYVASLYTPAMVHTLDEVLASPRPIEINFTFLKGVSRSIVESSWRNQFAHNATYTYPGFDRDQKTFISLLGNLDEKGRDTVLFLPGETQVLDQGKLMGTIQGANFQRAFFSLLFGEKPISQKLKVHLLGTATP